MYRLTIGIRTLLVRARERIAGNARAMWLLVVVGIALTLSWPLSRLGSQPSSPPHSPERLESLKEIREYRSVFRAYARGADSPGRLDILRRFANEGPAWLSRIQKRSSALDNVDLEHIDRAHQAFSRYAQSPARTPTDLGSAAANLIILAQTLDRVEASLAR